MFAPLHGKAVQQVPVTRLFGVTPSGQKACMHVHRVFPYLLVPVTPADVEGGLDACGNKWVEQLCHMRHIVVLNVSCCSRLTVSLLRFAHACAPSPFVTGLVDKCEAAMAATDPMVSAAGAGNRSRRQYVFSGELVRGKEFYGYCDEESVFVRMSVLCTTPLTSTLPLTSLLTLLLRYLYRPHDVTRLAGLLHGGKVGGEKSNRMFQPHDAHIPHHLQFMCDFNLVGMGIITGAQAPQTPASSISSGRPLNSIPCHVPRTPARCALPAHARSLSLELWPRCRRVGCRLCAYGGAFAEFNTTVRSACLLHMVMQ